MTEVISKQTVTARKLHYCDLCGEDIEPRMRYKRAFLKCSADTWTTKEHIECAEVAGYLCDGSSYGFDEMVEEIIDQLIKRDREADSSVIIFDNMKKNDAIVLHRIIQEWAGTDLEPENYHELLNRLKESGE